MDYSIGNVSNGLEITCDINDAAREEYLKTLGKIHHFFQQERMEHLRDRENISGAKRRGTTIQGIK